ncbi:competence protein CoiA family protein [Paenibacillus massiliensis]|uniref:competence protein CoiA family protein n=1 Tax=Paenibacillus massiliensis TaxID=225917 RepID=UPI000470F3E9|nr:competence protein CoiA family protein [Paenibacillus massiliensis]
MYHAVYEGKLFNIEDQINNSTNRKQAIDTLKKRADKGAYACPHCGVPLIVKSGDIRGVFFSHNPGEACALTQSYDTYKKQTSRESKQHSVMREIVHEVLKNQEKIHKDLNVDFGYIAKAEEKWSYYPDIILKSNDTEMAISILTNVDRSKDSKLTKQIKKRNDFFNQKGLQSLWFIEEQELSLDWENHVIHLWESEINLSIKTEEDAKWDKLVNELNSDMLYILDTFGYWRKKSTLELDTRSLYYIYSTQEGIDFSVHRFIIDEKQFPFRAFALTKGYRMSISTALSFNQKLALHDADLEQKDRNEFIQAYHMRKQKIEEEQNALQEIHSSLKTGITQNSKKMSFDELKARLFVHLGMTQKQQVHLWHNYVLKRGIKDFDLLWLIAQDLENFEQFEVALNTHLKK